MMTLHVRPAELTTVKFVLASVIEWRGWRVDDADGKNGPPKIIRLR